MILIPSSCPSHIKVPELIRGAGIKLNTPVLLAGLRSRIKLHAMTARYSKQPPIQTPPLWPWILVLSCTGIVVAAALALIGWVALALLGY